MEIPHALATGGLVAAAVALWSQIKATFSYASSFIIVRTELDYALSASVVRHLKSNWKQLPSGITKYTSRWVSVPDKISRIIVPFTAFPATSIYYKAWHVLLVNKNSQTITLASFRGFDFKRLISRSLDESEEDAETQSKSIDFQNRFEVIKVIGRDRYEYESRGKASNSSLSDSEISPAGESSETFVDFTRDNSFRFPKERYIISIKEDPFKDLFYPPTIQAHIDAAKKWFDLERWYIERSIPWRRGWLLYGPGGTGKSSLAQAIARSLGIPIYQYMLSTLTDQEFMERWDRMVTSCIVLFEDFDTVFKGRENITENKALTFDCILNQISGVASRNGIFLIVTTNHIESIDPAMGVVSEGVGTISTRPGRIDTVIKLGYIEKPERQKIANKILKDWPEEILALVDIESPVTAVQFHEMCLQKAFTLIDL